MKSCESNCIGSYSVLLNCTLYNVHYNVYTIRCALNCVHYIMYTILCTLYCIHYTMYTILCILYYVHYIVYTILCTLYCVHYTAYCVYYTVAGESNNYIKLRFYPSIHHHRKYHETGNSPDHH